MRFGVCTDFSNAAVLAEIGFDYVEIHTGDMMTLDEAEFAALCTANENSPIHAESANCLFPGEMALTGPEVDFRKTQEYLQAVMKRLGALGVSTVVFGSGGCRRIPQGFPREKAWQQLVQLGKILGAEAAPYGITVALEALRFAETNVINTVAQARKLVEDVNHPNFKMLCDLYHFHQVGDSLADLEGCGPCLQHIHIAKPDDRGVIYPGDGMDYDGFFAALRKAGYDGRVSFEGFFSDIGKQMPPMLGVLKSI